MTERTADQERENVILKVQKLLARSQSSFEAEAQTALLKAQQLLAKHNLSMADCEEVGVVGEVTHVRTEFSAYNAWVRQLGHITADNFCCDILVVHRGSYYRVVFVGFETDAKIAAQIFEYSAAFVDRRGSNVAQTYNDKGLSSRGIKADYIQGFLAGLKQAYAIQRTSTEFSLALVVPQEVKAEMSKYGSGSFPNASWGRGSAEARAKGYHDGQEYANQKPAIAN